MVILGSTLQAGARNGACTRARALISPTGAQTEATNQRSPRAEEVRYFYNPLQILRGTVLFIIIIECALWSPLPADRSISRAPTTWSASPCAARTQTFFCNLETSDQPVVLRVGNSCVDKKSWGRGGSSSYIPACACSTTFSKLWRKKCAT